MWGPGGCVWLRASYRARLPTHWLGAKRPQRDVPGETRMVGVPSPQTTSSASLIKTRMEPHGAWMPCQIIGSLPRRQLESSSSSLRRATSARSIWISALLFAVSARHLRQTSQRPVRRLLLFRNRPCPPPYSIRRPPHFLHSFFDICLGSNLGFSPVTKEKKKPLLAAREATHSRKGEPGLSS